VYVFNYSYSQKIVVDSGRNMWECFCIQELVQFVGDKLVSVYELHGSCKAKVKFTLEQDTKVQRGIEEYLYSFFNLGTRRGG